MSNKAEEKINAFLHTSLWSTLLRIVFTPTNLAKSHQLFIREETDLTRACVHSKYIDECNVMIMFHHMAHSSLHCMHDHWHFMHMIQSIMVSLKKTHSENGPFHVGMRTLELLICRMNGGLNIHHGSFSRLCARAINCREARTKLNFGEQF